jgi:hypothetical protein
MDDFDYEQLDAGIRDVVRLLRGFGFETCDSGDGSKYPEMECAAPFPMVACVVDPKLIIIEANRMQDVLNQHESGWSVEGIYTPLNQTGVLLATKD